MSEYTISHDDPCTDPRTACNLVRRGHKICYSNFKSVCSHSDWVDAHSVTAEGNYVVFYVGGERFIRWHHDAKRVARKAAEVEQEELQYALTKTYMRGTYGRVEFSASAESIRVHKYGESRAVFWLARHDESDQCKHSL